MSYIKCKSAFLYGLEGKIIEVEVDIQQGLPHLEIIGLPGSALRESKERVRSAIKNAGFQFPLKRITVNLAPAEIRKEGTYFDLAIAIGILLADHQLCLQKDLKLEQTVFIGELGLDGRVKGCKGIFSILLDVLQEEEIDTIVIPTSNLGDILLLNNQDKSFRVKHIKHLKAMTLLLEDANTLALPISKQQNEDNSQDQAQYIDFKDIYGHSLAKRVLEIAACGRHHLLLYGPPGSGKTMLAQAIQGILPRLTPEESLEVTKIYHAGGINSSTALYQMPPFRQPHHAASLVGLIGGGSKFVPGEITYAHRGVLFLDEFLEYKKSVLEALREPLGSKEVTIIRHHYRYRFPANFQLIVAFNPCPCGYHGFENQRVHCRCTPYAINSYLNKLSGPILDRIDIYLQVPYMDHSEWGSIEHNVQNEHSKHIRLRVEKGIAFRTLWRGKGKEHQDTYAYLEANCTADARRLFLKGIEKGLLRPRHLTKLLQLARTIADLEQSEYIQKGHIAEAIQLRKFHPTTEK